MREDRCNRRGGRIGGLLKLCNRRYRWVIYKRIGVIGGRGNGVIKKFYYNNTRNYFICSMVTL